MTDSRQDPQHVPAGAFPGQSPREHCYQPVPASQLAPSQGGLKSQAGTLWVVADTWDQFNVKGGKTQVEGFCSELANYSQLTQLLPLIYLDRLEEAGGDLGGLQVGRPKFANGEGFSHKKCFKSI